MRDAWRFQQRAWEIHFEIMYPLLAIYLQLYGVCIVLPRTTNQHLDALPPHALPHCRR